MTRPQFVTADERTELVRRGLWLNYATIGYNAFEAAGSLTAGALAGSVSLIGFGFDSAIEVTAAVAAQWRLRADHHREARERAEHASQRIIGLTFLALAAYVTYDSAHSLWGREKPDGSWLGIVILVLSVIIMPLLARSKRGIALALESRALEADAKQTSLCAYLSVIALTGVALNSLFGLWWADPVAALVMVPIIAKEGIEGLRGEAHCEDCGSGLP